MNNEIKKKIDRFKHLILVFKQIYRMTNKILFQKMK